MSQKGKVSKFVILRVCIKKVYCTTQISGKSIRASCFIRMSQNETDIANTLVNTDAKIIYLTYYSKKGQVSTILGLVTLGFYIRIP